MEEEECERDERMEKPIQVNQKKEDYDYDYGYGLKSVYSSASQISLSAEIVEAVMYDGRIGLTGSRGFEAAMWCGLGSFFIIGVTLIITGLFLTFF